MTNLILEVYTRNPLWIKTSRELMLQQCDQTMLSMIYININVYMHVYCYLGSLFLISMLSWMCFWNVMQHVHLAASNCGVCFCGEAICHWCTHANPGQRKVSNVHFGACVYDCMCEIIKQISISLTTSTYKRRMAPGALWIVLCHAGSRSSATSLSSGASGGLAVGEDLNGYFD